MRKSDEKTNEKAADGREQPDQRPITKLQAERLAKVSGVAEVRELAGATVAEIADKFRFRIDPELFLFRRVCGRVVKRDPATGALLPVPFATVHVEDTDCNLLGYFPSGWPYHWLFPLRCRREEIATTITDACGNFCVFVPRWEIDWILRFRHERICFPDIFIKPSLAEILDELRPIPQKPPIRFPPIPGPDPAPDLTRVGGMALRRAEELVGRQAAGRLAALASGQTLGAPGAETAQILAAPIPAGTMPPPLPALLQDGKEGDNNVPKIGTLEPLRALAARGSIDPKLLETLDVRQFVGPFRRCIDILIPEFVPLIDVPDITFRVTQDVDGNGTEEVIYSEGLFDVRWNAGPLPNVVLEASEIAVAGLTCDTPTVACAEPAIVTAGLMPLQNLPAPADPYHDAVTGYARRPNRPHPSGNLIDPLPNPLATAPYTGTLQLYGCNHRDGAQFYRVLYRFEGGSQVPFTNLTWNLVRFVGSPGHLETLHVMPDANGWYPILNDADGWFPRNLLLNWPTGQAGLYEIELQLGNAAKNPIPLPGLTATKTAIRVDNTRPSAQFNTLRWRQSGTLAWSAPLELVCPVIERPVVGGNPVGIELEVTYQVSAAHLRAVTIGGGGCGGDSPTLISAPATAAHWHVNALDNSRIATAIFSLPGTSHQGAYSFQIEATGRAFNPAGGDGGFEADYQYDPVYSYTPATLPIAIVNA